MSPYTNSQIYSLAVYLSNGLLVYAPIRPHVAHLVYAPICTPGLRTGLRIDPTSCYTLGLRTDLRARFTHRSGLTDRSKPIRFSSSQAQLEVLPTLPVLCSESQVEKKNRQHIWCLQSDGGKEYFSNEFISYLQGEGIGENFLADTHPNKME